VVTRAPGLICGALAADCAPVLIVDPQGQVAAAVHAGWQGALGGVVANAVQAMAALGADPSRMVAAVGPCIGPASYEVGPEFLERFARADPADARFFRPAAGDRRLFDLPGFVLERLRRAGVEACEWIGRDTCAEPDLFYSNRRAFKRGEPDYGRLLSAIVLA
jgi:polyphenol oxidase